MAELHRFPLPRGWELSKALLRSRCVPQVMTALYRAVVMSDLATERDIPAAERPFYQRMAEEAVQMCIDRREGRRE